MIDPDRKQRLSQFVGWTRQHVTGDEKGQAQLFLDRLLQAFGQRGLLEVGGQPEFRIRKSKEDGGGTAFADYVWKPVVLIEMKKRGEDLRRHYRQAFDYWTRLVPGRPRYAVLCNFDEFWVYDFETQMDTPVDQVTLEDLPGRYGPLAFLFPTQERPTFGNDLEAVTRDAADKLAVCFRKLLTRKVDRGLAQRFILQMLVALFAEDIDLLEKYMVIRLLDDCKNHTDSYDLIGGLFEAMNTPGGARGGRFKGVDYFNGGLFAQPARVELYPDELNQLKSAAKADWSKVRPEIFGTLFEQSLDADERHAFGAHFTSPVDIMKIVGPTIVEPWRQLIENASSGKELRQLRQRMHHYTVLDPACGSGNFLYIAYRELKRLEARIVERMISLSRRAEPAQAVLGFVTARQFFGMDINPFAVELAKVTMMIARKFAIDELHVSEPALPLDNLDENFFAGDSLIDSQGNQTPWPQADVIIGNPPFLGAKRLKPERGPGYVNAVRRAFPEVPGMADYCVYWFRRAHDHLPVCTQDDSLRGRAGLVGTQNIRNNQSRVGGLDHIVKTGTIVEAVDNQPWSGEANVHVSIANWVKTGESDAADEKQFRKRDLDSLLIPVKRRLWYKAAAPQSRRAIRRRSGSSPRAKEFELAFRECGYINSSLSDKTDVRRAVTLSCNRRPQRVFQGVTPGYDGFVLTIEDRERLVAKEPATAELIRPYLIGRELLSGDGRARRFLIDATDLTIIELHQYPTLFRYLQESVLGHVAEKVGEAEISNSDMVPARKEHLERWWTFWARRLELRRWLARHKRILCASRTQSWPFVFEFISTKILPGDKLQLFAFDDDFSFGVIQSAAHCLWYERRSSRLKNEIDYNYSTDAVFDSFPWPQEPSIRKVQSVAKAARAVCGVRAESRRLSKKGGLRNLYHTLRIPGKNPLKDAHAALDAAVLDAYGFSPRKDLLAQLLALNLEVAARIDAGQPVVSPGIPPSYPNPSELISDDCIRPSLWEATRLR